MLPPHPRRHTPRCAGRAARMATVLACVGLSACSLAPPHERPPLPTAASYPDETAAGPARPLDWQEFFVDPVLRELVGRALDNNRDLRIAAARIDEARALYGIQRADTLPNIAIGAGGARTRLPADLSPTRQATITQQYQVTLNLTAWELDFWGRLANLKDAALETYFASEAARRAVTLSLVAQVANTYLLERELDDRIALAGRTIASREDSQRITRRRYELGAASKIDAAQAETLLTQARAERASLQRLREQNHNALVLLLGTPVALAAAPLAVADDGFARPLAPGLPSDLLANRPDVLAAEHRLKAAAAHIGAARAAFFPRIVLTAGFGSASSQLEGLFEGGSRSWNFVPSLSLPLFDAGRTATNLDLAVARRDAAIADYERTVQAAFRDVADQLAAQRWLREQYTFQQATLAAQAERARLADLRYRSGAAPYLEVLDAERDLFAAEQTLVATRRQMLAAQVSLYAALGGATAMPATAGVPP